MYRFKVSSAFSGFLNAYERHIVLIYAAYIIVSCSLFFAASFLNTQEISEIAFVIPIAMSIFHGVVNWNFARKERYPYQLLNHQHIKTWATVVSVFCFFTILSIYFLIAVYFKTVFALVERILSIASLLTLSLMYSSLLLTFYSFPDHKEARLCFKLILEIFEKLSINPTKRTRIAYKNRRWFKRAFLSCNCFLVRKPYNRELLDINCYHNAIHNAMLIGTSKEIKQMSKNVENLLDSLGLRVKDVKLRKLLIALRRIAGKPPMRGKKSLTELSDVWKVSSRLDRLKSRMGSPTAHLLVAIILGSLGLLLQMFRLMLHA